MAKTKKQTKPKTKKSKTTSKSKTSTKSATKRKTNRSKTAAASKTSNTKLSQKLSQADNSQQGFFQKSLTISYASLTALGIVLLLALGFGAYRFNQWYTVATVNGEPITRFEVYDLMQQQGAGEVLDILITEKIVEQRARQEGINVSQAEIDAEIADIEENVVDEGQSLDDLLALQGSSRDQLTQQIRINKLIEQLVSPTVPEASDEAVQAFLEENQAIYADLETQEQQLQAAREDLENQNRREAFYNWIEEARAAAEIEQPLDF